MTTYQGKDNFSDGQIYDLQDPVLGGTDGQSNIPLEALFDRTAFLRNRIYQKSDSIASITANTAIDKTFVGKFLLVNCTSSNIALTLDPAANFPVGYILHLKAVCQPNLNVTVKASGNDVIFLNSNNSQQTVYLHDGEMLELLCGIAGVWHVVGAKGNFENVGNCVSAYVQQKGTLIRNGQLVSRAAYPRLWQYLSANSAILISDTMWNTRVTVNGISLPAYQGCFSTGDGSTTFRLPDDRGCFDRYLDMNRGLDTNRYYNYAGGYEADANGPHTHTFRDYYYAESSKTLTGNKATYIDILPLGYNNHAGSSGTDTDDDGVLYMDKKTSTNSSVTNDTGTANETIVKNTAKLPLIIF